MKKGFTLIELLVVVAIIGLLASVVLASLNISRMRAKNSAIVSNMQTVRSVAELYYDNSGSSYGTTIAMGDDQQSFGPFGWPCPSSSLGNIFDDPKIREAINSSRALYGNPNVSFGCAVGQNGQSWVLFVPMIQTSMSSPNYWCVASVGASKGLSSSVLSDLFSFGGGNVPAVCP